MKISFIGMLCGSLALAFSGCGQNPKPEVPSSSGFIPHPSHGGVLVALGDDADHVEFLADPAQGSLSAFITDDDAENPVRLKASSFQVSVQGSGNPFKVTLKAVASPLTGETVGDSSQFLGYSSRLKGLAAFDGKILSFQEQGQVYKNVAFHYVNPTPQGGVHGAE